MTTHLRKPDWIKIKLNTTEDTSTIRRDLRERGLTTVCEEARCPNLHECWSHHRTATFMILGNTCTRNCRFCAVKTGKPEAPDESEPDRIASSIEKLNIAHAVLTMVSRDDLPDGGARYLAAAGKAIHHRLPETTVEYLSSDMMGNAESIEILIESQPEILGHNIETVRRLTPLVRARSDYNRSLDFLRTARRLNKKILLKSSIMLGLGEEMDEILTTLRDIHETGCSIVNMGQYLQPTRHHLPVKKYWHPEEFDLLTEKAEDIGFSKVVAGPMVRSSYHAGNQFPANTTESLLVERGGRSSREA